jgi:hypothetical protein
MSTASATAEANALPISLNLGLKARVCSEVNGMKQVSIVDVQGKTIKVLGVQMNGDPAKLHIKINGVDILENLDATDIQVSIDKEGST